MLNFIKRRDNYGNEKRALVQADISLTAHLYTAGSSIRRVQPDQVFSPVIERMT